MIQNLGYLDSATTGSLELIALCDEIVGWLRRYLRKIEVDEQSLSLGLIREIGPDGWFLESEDTVSHLREDWVPRLFDRAGYETWEEEGRMTLEQRANRLVKTIIAEHRAPSLPEAIRRVLSNYLADSPAG
jgi:trimethylamine--corrinoid protein Co-methyltransferase